MKLYDFALSKLSHLKKRNMGVDTRMTESSSITQSKQKPISNSCILEVVPTKQNTKHIGANWLINFKDNRFSEHGEDGVIEKIFEILKPQNKWVCEFGAHDPEIISNTWRLINQEGWNALLIEADPVYFEKLNNYYKQSNSVYCVHTKVSYEGEHALDFILKDTPVPKDLDFMVIDIDGNDYHVWKAIENYQAKLVMIEFNAAIPIDVSFIQPPDLSINQGSSLKAMVELGKQKGYRIIAATSWNAFFVQEKYYSLFFENEPELEDLYVFPARHPIWMRPFQLYDGTIVIAPWNSMLWHKIDLKPEDYQVLPNSLRCFQREMAVKDYVIEKSGEKQSIIGENVDYLNKILHMPQNVLGQFANNVYSRFGEDGIIEKLIGAVSSNHLYLVDVGAFDGITASKSRNLIQNHAWRSLLIENDTDAFDKLQRNTTNYPKVQIFDQSLSLSGKNSLDDIFTNYAIPKDFELLLLNVYGMEFYLWESLSLFSPRIVGVQFNPTIPNDIKFIQEENFDIHQGSSLRALLELAHYKGYELIAVTLETAFFVKRDYFYRLFEMFKLKQTDIDEIFCPIKMHLFQLYDGTLSLDGLNRLMWHGLRIDEEKLQVVPKALRKFHQYADQDNKRFFYRV